MTRDIKMQNFIQELSALNKNNPHADAIINTMAIDKSKHGQKHKDLNKMNGKSRKIKEI